VTAYPPATLASNQALGAWGTDWAAFRQEYPDWPAAANPGDLLYCLPVAAIDRLACAHGTAPALLAAGAAAAERAYAQLCDAHHAVSCWQGQPVRYPYLRPPAAATPDAAMSARDWSPADVAGVREQCDKAPGRFQRLKGCVGWLLTDPGFMADLGALAAQRHALPAYDRPAFPLAQPLPAPAVADDFRPAPPAVAAFAEALRTFLDRWGLVGLDTWDLPRPTGPQVPCALAPGAPAMPVRGVYLFIPFHYPVLKDDELLREIRAAQQALASAHGVALGLAGLTEYKAYAHVFDVLHLDWNVRSRYPPDSPPAGFVGAIEDAAQAALGLSAGRVEKLRKHIAACLRGRRGRAP